MRAILIDPTERTVTEVDFRGELKGFYKVLDCGCVDALQINGNIFEDGWHSVYFDDYGLYREPPHTRFFQIRRDDGSTTPPIPGRGLIVGHNREKTADATMTVEEVRTAVTFSERRFRGFRSVKPGLVHHPVLGEVFQVGITADLPIVDGADEEGK